MSRKVDLSSGGSKTVLRGAPASENAVGLNVYFDGGGRDAGGGDGDAVDRLGGEGSLGLGGTGGGRIFRSRYLLSRASFAGKDGSVPPGVGLGPGGKGSILHSILSSLAGTDGYW